MKKSNKWFSLALGAVLCLSTGVSCGEKEESNLKIPDYDPYACFWEEDIVQNETVVLTVQADGSISGNLLFNPTEIVCVKNYTLEKTYQKSEYTFEGNKLIATADSTMPYMTQSMLKGEEGAETFFWKPYDTGYVYTEGLGIVMHQVAVTYRYENQTMESAPKYDGDKLVNSMAKLKKGEDIGVFLIGDSISYGCNSSKQLGTAPYLPAYGEGLCNELSKRYSANVKFANGAVGGWKSAEGVNQVKSAVEVATQNLGGAPHLAIIAFGMNDASWNIPVAEYKKNIQEIIDIIRANDKNTDIVIISTIQANPEGSQDKSLTLGYAEADKQLCTENERTVNVDMTSFSAELYQTKKGVDILANNVNHPSDFLMRCYDICLLKVLCG